MNKIRTGIEVITHPHICNAPVYSWLYNINLYCMPKQRIKICTIYLKESMYMKSNKEKVNNSSIVFRFCVFMSIFFSFFFFCYLHHSSTHQSFSPSHLLYSPDWFTLLLFCWSWFFFSFSFHFDMLLVAWKWYWFGRASLKSNVIFVSWTISIT